MEDKVVKALQALEAALRSYARIRGPMEVSILRAAGLREMRISMRALYRYHEEDTFFTLLQEAVKVLLGHAGLVEKELGVKLLRRGSEVYLLVPLETLERLTREG